MAQLVEGLSYKTDGGGLDCRYYRWKFSLTQFFRPHHITRVDSVSNRNKYQGYFLEPESSRCVQMTTLPPSCADCLQNVGALTSWNPQALSRAVQGLLDLV
jgi:hypothetical protein